VKTAAITLLLAAIAVLAWLGREGDTRDARAGIGVALVLAAVVAVALLFHREKEADPSPGDPGLPQPAAAPPTERPSPTPGESPPEPAAAPPAAADRPIRRSTADAERANEQGKWRTREPTRDTICAAILRRLNAGQLPKLEGDVFRVYDRVCQRREPLEAVPEKVPGMTMAQAEAAWATLRSWVDEEA
jgi:hypothetical protein